MEQSLNNGMLLAEMEELRRQLYEANEALEAIRTGQVDALVVHNNGDHELYTLKTADHAYRLLIEKMSEGVVTLSPEGIILYANSQFAKMVGKELSEVIGLYLHQFIRSESRSYYDGLLAACWKGECKGDVLLASDKEIHVQLSLTALELAEQSAVNIILTDLTAQKAAQKELEDANRKLAQANQVLEARNQDLQQFASVASHDLQEPLRKVQMFSSLLKIKDASNISDDGIGYLDKIIVSTQRMKDLVVDVLSYSRLSMGRQVFGLIDLNEIVSGILDDFELLIREKKAVVNVGPLPQIEANSGQIRQLIQNLLSNALKFSRKGTAPVIEISAERVEQKSFDSKKRLDGPFCLLRVKDNGIGFEQKYADQIFSLFERLNSKDQFEGTGIGLAVSKKIIENHGGLIGVRSIPEEGSVFQIILPVQQK